MKRLAIVLVITACSDAPKQSVKDLEDPASCMECHDKHYTEWSGSMHAYATDDPVFVAMQKRGQRDTNGQLGTFCVQCHAPMAVALGTITAANAATFDVSTLPAAQKGITCYFCHDVKSVKDDHNNGLVLALDQTMRGGVKDPTDSPAHFSSYDKKLMASATNDSVMCGSCHDVTTPAGVKLERTYAEWQTTIFATNDPANLLPLTCSACHMQSDQSTTVIADKPGLDVKSRPNSFHEHMWLGIDQDLTMFSAADAQAAQAAAIQRDLKGALTIVGPTPIGGTIGEGGICVTPMNGGQITVRIDSRGTGHMWPTGAAQDRRAWLEVIAYDVNNQVVFQSGVVPADKDPEDVIAAGDPNLFGFWDTTKQANGMPAHFFWQVVDPVDSHLLRPPVTLDTNSPAFDHSSTATFSLQGITTPAQIDHVTAQVYIRPFEYAVLQDLVSSGDLDASIVAKLMQPNPALAIPGTTRRWIASQKDPSTDCEKDPFY